MTAVDSYFKIIETAFDQLGWNMTPIHALYAEWERINNERDEYRLSHDALVTGRTYKDLIARAEKAETERDVLYQTLKRIAREGKYNPKEAIVSVATDALSRVSQ